MKEEEGDESEAQEEEYENYDSNYRTEEQEEYTGGNSNEGRVQSKRWDQLYELVMNFTKFMPMLKSA